MADQFVAEIRIFAGNFAPTGWALCNGQLLPISQNTALFSLLGNYYGGDGKSTFGLPDLQGAGPMNQGQGAGLSPRFLGEVGGEPSVTLLESEMASHVHTPVQGDGTNGGTTGPQNNGAWASTLRGLSQVYSNAAPNTPMNALALSVTGGSLPHNNMSPYLTLTFIIALQGIFPPRG